MLVTSRLFNKHFDPATDTTGFAWRADPKLSGGGIFFEGACHTLDFLDFLFGPIEEVRGFAVNQGGKYKSEDLITGAYRFASGVMGQGTWCYTADYEYEMNEIVGTNGRIQFSTTAPVPIRVFHGDTSRKSPLGDPPHVHQPLIQTIVDEMNGKGKCPSTGESGSRTARVHGPDARRILRPQSFITIPTQFARKAPHAATSPCLYYRRAPGHRPRHRFRLRGRRL